MAMRTTGSRPTSLDWIPWIDTAPPRWLLLVAAVPGLLVGAATGAGTTTAAGTAGVPAALAMGALVLAVTFAGVVLAAVAGWSAGVA